MNKDPASSLAYALSTATACRELADDAARDGRFPAAMASTMSRAALEAASGIRQMLDTFRPNVSDETFTLLGRCIVDLEAIGALASLVVTCESATRSARHLAHALRYTADMAANHLTRAEQAVI